MKKRTKLLTGALTVLAGVLLLSSCTASFCSETDKAHILYAFDYGICDYCDAEHRPTDNEGNPLGFPAFEGNTNVYYTINVPTNNGSGIGRAYNEALKAGLQTPSWAYYEKIDQYVLNVALIESKGQNYKDNIAELKLEDVVTALDQYGYQKFSGEKLWDNWTKMNQDLREMTANPANGITLDDLPTNDFLTLYKNGMNSIISSYRSCIAIDTKDYGYYGYANGAKYRESDKVPVQIEEKSWAGAWMVNGKFTFFEGLLVYPIAWLTETFVSSFKNGGVAGGVAQLLAIFLITFIVRSLMLIVTIKQTAGNAKMQQLQPEITKIQNKYPNANTNNYEKQQMGAEMQKLYKKHKINPLATLVTMVVQFPVFICVWGALQGCASLSSDALFNLHLSDSINNVLFNAANWSNGSAPTALVLFLLMAAAQVISMLLPQWLQKAKRKKVASLGKNPAQTQQQNNMKMFTYIMMAMIIFMGFTLPSAMGVYWFVGALFSICQTVIIDRITAARANKKGR